jgi:hypothetical protein
VPNIPFHNAVSVMATSSVCLIGLRFIPDYPRSIIATPVVLCQTTSCQSTVVQARMQHWHAGSTQQKLLGQQPPHKFPDMHTRYMKQILLLSTSRHNPSILTHDNMPTHAMHPCAAAKQAPCCCCCCCSSLQSCSQFCEQNCLPAATAAACNRAALTAPCRLHWSPCSASAGAAWSALQPSS